jgi:hypothetical protein
METGNRKLETGNRKLETRKWLAPLVSLGIAVLLIFAAYCLLPTAQLPTASADAYSWLRHPVFQAITDTPTITITTAGATSGVTPTTGAREADIQWNFGTVAGSYTTCTVQAQTSFDGSSWMTLGSAASVTVSSSTQNVWKIIEQGGTTAVTTGTPSTTAASGFAAQTKYVFACSGSYGTRAPVTISVIYK